MTWWKKVLGAFGWAIENHDVVLAGAKGAAHMAQDLLKAVRGDWEPAGETDLACPRCGYKRKVQIFKNEKGNRQYRGHCQDCDSDFLIVIE